MHISEGVLSAPVLLSGAALTAAGTAVGLKKLDYDKIPQAAMLAAVFFLATLVHVPVGPSAMHLVLNGLLGLILGWAAFPAILIGLALQAVLFQFGGLTGLGVNTLNMALPAIVCYYLFGGLARGENRTLALGAAFMSGVTGIILSGLMVGFSLVFTGESFLGAAETIVVAHIPVMIVEGLITVALVSFLRKVKPEVLHAAVSG